MKNITDKDYLNLLRLKQYRETLRKQLQETESRVDEMEEIILDRIHSGEKIAWGWEYQIERTNISWKDKFIEYAGKKEADLISATTPNKIYPHVGIVGFDNPEEKIPVKQKPRRLKLRRKNI